MINTRLRRCGTAAWLTLLISTFTGVSHAALPRVSPITGGDAGTPITVIHEPAPTTTVAKATGSIQLLDYSGTSAT